MRNSFSKEGCAALLFISVAMFSDAANALGVLPQAPEEPASGLPVVNDGYLTVANTFDSEAIPPKFCPPDSTFRPDDSIKTPCEHNKFLTGKDGSYPEMTAQALLDMEYGRGKVQFVGVGPKKPGYSVLYWRYAPTQAVTPPVVVQPAAPVVNSPAAGTATVSTSVARATTARTK